MREIRYTLLADGPSDKALIPIITWLLRVYFPDRAIQSEWADLWRLPRRPTSLAEKIERSIELYPCDLLFVHRDAEREPRDVRVNEINEAINEASTSIPSTVCVIPVRMQEAWLLFDQAAIRRAAGNPNGHQLLRLPPIDRVERLPNPKRILHSLLREASGLSGRRRARLQVGFYAARVSEFITDFTPLRALAAFDALEADIKALVVEQT
jgi:hypothetical protein